MKTTKFSESQIVGILKQQEQRKKVGDICREHGISQPTVFQQTLFSSIAIFFSLITSFHGLR